MQSNKCITRVSEGRKRENGAEKYFKKQCLKTSQFGEKYELADIYAQYIQREPLLRRLYTCC